jgi:hypothetical protein
MREKVDGLSAAQRALVLASGPDDITGKEGHGVEIRGAQYRVARSLEAKGLGSYTHGDPFYDMYWNNAGGLKARAAITRVKESDNGQ